MPDDEGQFLDALYLGVRDGTEFDQALALLCAMFDVASGALIDFDAARPDVAAQSADGVFSGETARLYEREFAALDPAPPAFMSRPAGTAIPTYRLLPEERRRPGVFFSVRSDWKSAWAERWRRRMAALLWSACIARRTAKPSMTRTSPSLNG